MGKAPGDDVSNELQSVEKEVDELRERTQQLIVELERRIQERITGARETVERVKHAVDVKAQLREHPRVAAGVSAATLVAIGVGTWYLVHQMRERRRFVPRVTRKARALGAIISDPERHLQKKEPIGRRILGAVLATAATVIVRAVAQRLVKPMIVDRRRLEGATIPSA